MRTGIGKHIWSIAEGYIPGWSEPGAGHELVSHEALCILNTCETDAHVELMIFFSNRAPAGPYKVKVPAQRTEHLRLNDLRDPEVIPTGTDYSCVLTSDVPVVVQHTRLDSRSSSASLMSTIAYSE